jgi:hypothetical protein
MNLQAKRKTILNRRGDNRTHTIDNTQDVIDSRDVIARIAELEETIAADEISEDNGATPQLDDNGNVREVIATCGECGMSWNDALISGRTPAPSARCQRPAKRRTKCLGCGRLLDSWCYKTRQAMRADGWPCHWEMDDIEAKMTVGVPDR